MALAGVLLGLAVALSTATSIVGRYFLSKPIFGDVEIVQLGIALCISLCLPCCQWQRANIIVDFFTQRLQEKSISRLDGVGALLIALVYALLAWRSGIGARSVHEAQEATMILDLPMWWAYAGLVPGLTLSAVIATWQSQRLLSGQEWQP